MIITQTPFRMSFFGGGTDFPDFYREHGGAVLSTTFDKYCYVTVRHLPPFFDYRSELVYARTERVTEINEIRHPAIREAMRWLDMHELRVTYDADLPAHTGLGTSSSFAVGLLSAFYALKSKQPDKRRLADDAIYLERTLCGESGGVQDQIAVSFGGFNRIDFDANGYRVTPLGLAPERLEMLNDNLMMFFTGFSRMSPEIQVAHQSALKEKAPRLLEMKQLTDEAERVLRNGDLSDFGRLLDHTWQLKRGVTDKISTATIDDIYARAMGAGALGGKLLGAGGGGFLVFYVEKDKQSAVRRALRGMTEVSFRFETGGTRILYYVPETYTRQCTEEDA